MLWRRCILSVKWETYCHWSIHDSLRFHSRNTLMSLISMQLLDVTERNSSCTWTNYNKWSKSFDIKFMKRQNQNRPSPFPGTCRTRRLKRLNLSLVFCIYFVHFFWLMNVCYCCVRFSFFSIPGQGFGFGNVSEMTYFVFSRMYNHNSVNQAVVTDRPHYSFCSYRPHLASAS